MQILLERPDIVIVDKPAGLPSIADRFGSTSVQEQLQALRGEKLWVTHRLDREVTGILVFARTAEAHRALSMAFEQQRIHKTYLAYSGGQSPGEVGTSFTWKDLLLRGKKRAYVHPTGKPAHTDARFDGQAAWPNLWQWTLEPRTGRNHQLRVHLASRGWPIAGDVLYGSTELWPLPGIALRAVRLEVPPGVLGAALVVEAAPWALQPIDPATTARSATQGGCGGPGL